MITRIWRGWTTPESAAPYQSLLLDEIFPGIESRNLPGYRGISLLRCEEAGEVEFMTLMWFDSVASIRVFAGENYEVAVVPAEAQALLSRFEERSAHYETIVSPPPSVAA